MTEAVIVAAARFPIGRAAKGALVDMRPDDLAAQMVSVALAQVPALDVADIDDLDLGCGLPGGEQGFQIARNVAVQLGYDGLPGTTVTRYCSSSLQTTRMSMHAIRAGEDDAFISAGGRNRVPVCQGHLRFLTRHAQSDLRRRRTPIAPTAPPSGRMATIVQRLS